MEASAGSDTPMDIPSDGITVVDGPSLGFFRPRSRARNHSFAFEAALGTFPDGQAFVSSLERPHSRRVLGNHDSFLFHLEGSAVNPEASTDLGQPQAPAPDLPLVCAPLVWFIPNDPPVPQEGSRRRQCPWHDASGDSRDAALRVCRRHGLHNLGKHVHLQRSHHPRRCRSCPPDPRVLGQGQGQGQGHGSGRPPHRPHRIWLPSGRLPRNTGTCPPGAQPFLSRHGFLRGRNSRSAATISAVDDPISAALEENARAMQSLRITSDVPQATVPQPQEEQQGAAGGTS